MRLLIFGLSRSTRAQDVQRLLGATPDLQLEMVEVPGANDDAFAVVQLAQGPLAAWRLAQRLNARTLNGRRLQSWVPVMNWS